MSLIVMYQFKQRLSSFDDHLLHTKRLETVTKFYERIFKCFFFDLFIIILDDFVNFPQTHKTEREQNVKYFWILKLFILIRLNRNCMLCHFRWSNILQKKSKNKRKRKRTAKENKSACIELRLHNNDRCMCQRYSDTQRCWQCYYFHFHLPIQFWLPTIKPL